MLYNILVSDVALTGASLGLEPLKLTFEREEITVEQLIEMRIREEVDRYISETSAHISWLVQPSLKEKLLNGEKKVSPRHIDIEQQIAIAKKAFNDKHYLVLIDGRQLESLTDVVIVHDALMVKFVKLLALVGG